MYFQLGSYIPIYISIYCFSRRPIYEGQPCVSETGLSLPSSHFAQFPNQMSCWGPFCVDKVPTCMCRGYSPAQTKKASIAETSEMVSMDAVAREVQLLKQVLSWGACSWNVGRACLDSKGDSQTSKVISVVPLSNKSFLAVSFTQVHMKTNVHFFLNSLFQWLAKMKAEIL